MILSARGNRTGSGTCPATLSMWRRLRLIAPALAMFGVALGLPAFRLNLGGWGNGANSSGFEFGWLLAFWTEAIAFDAAWELGQTAFGVPPARGMLQLTDSWPILAGGTANHLFALSCLMALLRRLRLATLLSGISALAALGSLLPGQFMEWDRGWLLGPGYFLWCAAPLVLMQRTWRGATGRLAPADIPAGAPSPEDSIDFRRPV